MFAGVMYFARLFAARDGLAIYTEYTPFSYPHCVYLSRGLHLLSSGKSIVSMFLPSFLPPYLSSFIRPNTEKRNIRFKRR